LLFIRETIVLRDIKTEFVNSNNQLEDIFTKSLWDLELIIFVRSLIHTVYMHKLKGQLNIKSLAHIFYYYVNTSIYK